MAEDKRLPLNGTKTHQLSRHAIAELKNIALDPVPRCAVNPGVANRLLREELVEQVSLPTPYPTHLKRGIKNCVHLKITEAGRQAIDGGNQ